MTPGGIGDELGERGLAGAGRTPQDDGREEFIGFGGRAQKFALRGDAFLPDKFLEGARPHARRQRRTALQAFLHRVVESIRQAGIHPLHPPAIP